ncbi:MAG: hypothetical protein JXA30_10125 [Deltaproteobacteria bacterium]|nr:hypothetical protein [Deltaproteobacteria bacterium]
MKLGRFIVLVVTFCWSVTATAKGDEVDKLVMQARAELDKRWDKPDPNRCSKLNRIWDKIPKRLDPDRENHQTLMDIQDQLFEVRKIHDCLRHNGSTSQGSYKPRSTDDQANTYLQRLKKFKDDVVHCDPKTGCPELVERRNELPRQAAHLLRNLDLGSESALKVEKSIRISLPSDENTALLIDILASRKLSPEEYDDLLKVVLSDSQLVNAVQQILQQLASRGLTKQQVADILKGTLNIAFKQGIDPIEVLKSAAVKAMLADKRKRNLLLLVLEQIVKRYPDLTRTSQNARAELVKDQPDETIVQTFFDSIDPVVISEAYKDTKLTNTLVPNAAMEIGTAPSPVLVHLSYNQERQKGSCRVGDEFLRKFNRTLHYQGGPKSGLLPYVEVTDMDQIEKDVETIISEEGESAPCKKYSTNCPANTLNESCTEEFLPYARLCSFPKPGIFLLGLNQKEDVVEVTVKWWARSDTGGWDSGDMVVANLPVPCDEEEEDRAGLHAARKVAKRVSLFKPGLLPPPPAPILPTPVIKDRSSGWCQFSP